MIEVEMASLLELPQVTLCKLYIAKCFFTYKRESRTYTPPS